MSLFCAWAVTIRKLLIHFSAIYVICNRHNTTKIKVREKNKYLAKNKVFFFQWIKWGVSSSNIKCSRNHDSTIQIPSALSADSCYHIWEIDSWSCISDLRYLDYLVEVIASDCRDGGVQQLISEQLQRQGDGVPETCPEHWDQHPENTTKWWVN